MTELTLLLLILVANGAPVIATRLCGAHAAWPVDAGLMLPDGHPLFGPSKTWRGVLSALTTSTVAGLICGWPWNLGFTVGAGAMLGDLLSSFCKRRLGLASSSEAFGLDQIPEALFPMLAMHRQLALGLPEVIILTVLFVVLGRLLSRILYRLHIRREPY